MNLRLRLIDAVELLVVVVDVIMKNPSLIFSHDDDSNVHGSHDEKEDQNRFDDVGEYGTN